MAVGDAKRGKRAVEVEVETDCDEGYVWHLPLHRNKRGLMADLWKALYGKRDFNSPFFNCPGQLSPQSRLLGML